MLQWCVCSLCRISPDGSTLTVTGARTTDSGKFTCVATNNAGQEDRIFNLNVYGGFNRFYYLYFDDDWWLSLTLLHIYAFSASRDRRQQRDSCAVDHSFGEFCQHWVCCYRLSTAPAQLAEKRPASASVLPHTASFRWTGAPVGQWTGLQTSS